MVEKVSSAADICVLKMDMSFVNNFKWEKH